MRQFSGKIYIEGAGRLASHLAPALKAAGLLSGIHTRDEKKSSDFAALLGVPVFGIKDLSENDIVFCAVPDDAMPEVLGIYSKKCFAVSVSGSVDILDLAAQNTGVFYPLQTFSVSGPVDFSHIPVLLEAENPELLFRLQKIAEAISLRSEIMTGKQRKILHISAVFVNNFVTYISAHGKAISVGRGIDFSLLKPLIDQTFANILSKEELFSSLTGPARRKDESTINEHLAQLSGETARLYEFLTNSIQRHYDQL